MTDAQALVESTSPDGSESDSVATRPSRCARWLSLMLKCWLGFSFVAWLLGTLLQLLVRDHFSVLTPVFYALPWPIVVWFGATGVWFVRRKHARIRGAVLISVLMQLVFWLYGSVSMSRPMSDEPVIRLMVWNVCRGFLGPENVAADINASNADVVALVEATHESQTVAFWQKQCPGYQSFRLGSGMVVLVKGQLIDWGHGNVNDVLRYRLLNLAVKENQFTLLLLDITSDPFVSRSPALDQIRKLAIEHRAVPFLAAGDFNTPPESIHFDDLRDELDKAFEACGEGYRETWPVIAPVLDLDQVWGNQKIKWQRCWRGWSLHSDHRPVFVEFRL